MENYIIVSAKSFTELQGEVNKKIPFGYVPVGGITDTGTDTTHGFFLQAMVMKAVLR